MKIHGREIRFKKTVKGTSDIAKICPNGDLKQIGALFESENTAVMQDAMATFIVAMSEGYEYSRAFEEDYEPRPLTMREVQYLDHDKFLPLFQEAVEAFKADAQTIKAEGKKTQKAVTKSN